MKKVSLFALTLSLLLASHGFATCPTAPTVYQTPQYVDWTQDSSCYTLTGTISGTTVSCYSGAGWSFDGAGLNYAVASFTADGQYIENNSNWSAASFIELNSPGSSSSDWVELLAVVTHNGSDTPYVLFYWDGSMGSLSGCAQQYGTFSAVGGDTVSIKIYAANSGSATIRASYPRIANSLY